jgi:endonuclease G
MTNHHVLGDKAIARTSVVEFDYQVSVTGALLQTTNFSIDPDTFFFADERLDYAIVAVRETAQNGRLSEYGWNPLIEEEGKAIISQWVTARYEAARAALEDFLYEGAPVPKNRSIVSERKASTK